MRELLRIFIHRLAALFRRRRLEDDLDEELRSHLDMAVELNLSKGMSLEEARREAFALVGVALAWVMYGRVPVPAVAPRGRPLTVAARKDLYGDAFNESVLMRPGQWLTRLSVFFDNRGVDGLVNTLAAAVGGTSGRVRKLQTGFVRSYALSMFFGAAVLVALLLVVRL